MGDQPHTLNDWPLWRLLVELHDAERCYGPNSPTVRVLARVIRERLDGVQKRQPVREAPNA